MTTKELTPISGETTWSYPFFREYLLAVARDRKFVPPTSHFPAEIELSQDWHTLLNGMRERTKTEELYAITASDGIQLFQTRVPRLGRSDCVPNSIVMEEVDRVNKAIGEDTVLGDIHSHPDHFGDLWVKDFPPGKEMYEQGLFSIGDLQQLITTYDHFRKIFSIVTTKHWNAAVFLTRDTKKSPPSAFGDEYDITTFERYWYQDYGSFTYQGDSLATRLLIPGGPGTRDWKVYKGVGKEYSLVFYKGRPGENLKKIFPLSK